VLAKGAFWKLKELLKGDVNITRRKIFLNCIVFSVLKYGCESWTVNKSLMKKYMLLNIAKNQLERQNFQIKNQRKRPRFYREMVRQKLSIIQCAISLSKFDRNRQTMA